MLRSNFKYNGKSLSDYQMKMYDADADPQGVVRTIDKASQNAAREVANQYATYRNDVLTHHFLIIKDPELYASSYDLRLTDKDIHALKSWLFSTSTPTELILPVDDEEIEVSYFGVFTDVQYYVPVAKSCFGLQLTFTCNAPYGFSPITSKRYNITGADITGDYLNNVVQFTNMVPPTIVIHASADQTFRNEVLTIINHNDGDKEMHIMLPSGMNRITIDCQTKVITGSTPQPDGFNEIPLTLNDIGIQLFEEVSDSTDAFQLLNLYGNLYWLNLIRGSNMLQFQTTHFENAYTVEICTRYIIEAGGF